MAKGQSISLDKIFSTLKFLANRTPDTTDGEAAGAFAKLSDYRDGAVFIGHYAGQSEWERHSQGDEIVFVVEGATTLILLDSKGEHPNLMGAGDLLVVPQNQWHRFVTPDGVKIMSVTPQPTDHSREKPTIG